MTKVVVLPKYNQLATYEKKNYPLNFINVGSFKCQFIKFLYTGFLFKVIHTPLFLFSSCHYREGSPERIGRDAWMGTVHSSI